MLKCLVYLKLELKRAWKRLPYLYAGAIVLLILTGTVAFLCSKVLYGEAAVERVSVGVVIPEDDAVGKKVIAMVSSLDSVKSICDFRYMGRTESLEQLKAGKIHAVMDIPEEFVQGIMNGTNTPVKIVLSRKTGPEGLVLKELTEAGAATLGASQAGIYAGDELCRTYDMPEALSLLESDLNRIYLSYSLPRLDYFKRVMVSATGDVNLAYYYGISAVVLLLLLGAIPVSEYLMPCSRVMRQKLTVSGIGIGMQVSARVLGLALLFGLLTLPVGLVGIWKGWLPSGPMMIPVWLLVCVGAASFVVAIYRAAGSLMGGIMLLFLAASGQHFLAGGFFPVIFLPKILQPVSAWMPSKLLMDGMKMMVTADWAAPVFGRLLGLTVICILVSMAMEKSRR